MPKSILTVMQMLSQMNVGDLAFPERFLCENRKKNFANYAVVNFCHKPR